MNKSLIVALLIMAVAALVMILTKGDCNVNLIGWHVSPRSSIVILVSMIAGVTSGVLLR